MARWLYLLSIPYERIAVLKEELIRNEFEPILSVKHDASPIAYNTTEITISIDVHGKVRKNIAEGFFKLGGATSHGKPLREFEENKLKPAKFFRFLIRKYAKRKWFEAIALYLGTIFSVGGYDLLNLIHERFDPKLLKDLNFPEILIMSLVPVVVHVFYGYAHMPRESEVKLDNNS